MDSTSDGGEITTLLRAWRAGDSEALDRLVPLVYPKLRRIAAAFLRRETPGHTLDATGLVHELYFRIVNQRQATFDDRQHFYSFAAHVMRRVLRDWARDRSAQKRGGHADRVPLSEFLAWIDAASEEMIDLSTALDELESLDARKVRLLELKVFLGCSTSEAAEIIGISKATADRDLQLTKAWLFRRLRGNGQQESEQT